MAHDLSVTVTDEFLSTIGHPEKELYFTSFEHARAYYSGWKSFPARFIRAWSLAEKIRKPGIAPRLLSGSL